MTKLLKNPFLFGMILSGMFLLSSCGSGDSASDGSASGTGELVFHVAYYAEAGPSQLRAAVIDCSGEGIATVEAAVYGPDNALLRNGGPWNCDAGQGTIASVPAGSGRTIVILGRNSDGNVVFRGQKSDIQVEADRANDAGAIDCYAFAPSLQAPADGAVVNAGSMGLAWNAVAGATEYHVRVSQSSDLSDPVIDETVSAENFTPSGLSNTRTYYWQIVAGDAFMNRSIGSQVWSFTVDAQHQNTSPVAQITSPSPDSEFTTDDTISFSGSGSDNEDGSLSGTSLVWYSDLDGLIGTGAAFDSDTLSEGSHQITLTAIDSAGARGATAVTIIISDPGPGQCVGHEDPDTGCTTCLPGWADVDGDHCGTLVRYVDIDNYGAADLDGLTWSTATFAVQDGIDACQTALLANANESRCEVWVAEGTYYIYQTAIHNSVHLRPNVHVFGGFSGTETSPDQRNWTDHPTTLDGHKDPASTEQVEHVVLCEQEGLIDGFIITGGSNHCDNVYMGGGGMYASADSKPVVRNTVFRNNMVECNYGGGMYAGADSTSTLINCTFENNESEHGGALFATGGAVLRAENCLFQDNFAWSEGGAVLNKGAKTVFIQCRFIANTASSYYGSAIDSQEYYATSEIVNPVLEVDGCLFTDNIERFSGGRAGAVSLNQAQATIKNSGFVGNTTTGTGAAVSSTGADGTLDISNSYFYKNIVGSPTSNNTINGGGVHCVENRQVTLTNCTMIENEVQAADSENAFGGGLYSIDTPVTITNCIIRGNVPHQVTSSNPAAAITYSNVAGITLYPVQDRNIDLPVYFAGDADFHLLAHDPNDATTRNPCIDAGNGDIAPATDFDGNPRVDDPQTPNNGSGTPGYVDMGAFEYQP